MAGVVRELGPQRAQDLVAELVVRFTGQRGPAQLDESVQALPRAVRGHECGECLRERCPESGRQMNQ